MVLARPYRSVIPKAAFAGGESGEGDRDEPGPKEGPCPQFGLPSETLIVGRDADHLRGPKYDRGDEREHTDAVGAGRRWSDHGDRCFDEDATDDSQRREAAIAESDHCLHQQALNGEKYDGSTKTGVPIVAAAAPTVRTKTWLRE